MFRLTLILILVLVLPRLGLGTNATNSVPELAEGYELVYDLDLAKRVSGASVPYRVDRSAMIETGSFDRIAYFIDLTHRNGNTKWVWVSMEAFTPEAALTGVPVTPRHTRQQLLKHMNVFTGGVPKVSAGTDIATGNIEFWTFNYGGQDGRVVPGNEESYGMDDRPVGNGHYGSMQIHNHGTGETLFAYNGWRHDKADIGIGTAKKMGRKEVDWTFSSNADNYTHKVLQVYVRPKVRGLFLALRGGGESAGPFLYEGGTVLVLGGSRFEITGIVGEGMASRFKLQSAQTGKMYGPFSRKPGSVVVLGRARFIITQR